MTQSKEADDIVSVAHQTEQHDSMSTDQTSGELAVTDAR